MTLRDTPLSDKTRPRPSRRTGVRARAAKATRETILRAAIRVFARHGYDGASVDKISRAARSFDRMIYYYYGSKQGLYVAALEEIYRRFNEAEASLALDPDRPLEGLETLAGFMVDYYRAHPEFVNLLNTENLHRGRHIAKSVRAHDYSSPALGAVGTLLRAGAASGELRADLSARDFYLVIAALGYFYQSNQFTLSAFLGEDLHAPDASAHWRAFVVETVRRIVLAPRAQDGSGRDAG